MGCHFLLQGIVLAQGLNLCLLCLLFFTIVPPGLLAVPQIDDTHSSFGSLQWSCRLLFTRNTPPANADMTPSLTFRSLLKRHLLSEALLDASYKIPSPCTLAFPLLPSLYSPPRQARLTFSVLLIYCLSGHPPPPEALGLVQPGVLFGPLRSSVSVTEGEGLQSLRMCSCNKHTEAWTHGPPTCLRGKESASQFRSCGFHPWVRKIPWRKKSQPTPVFLPGKLLDRAAWRSIVPEVTKSRTPLSTAQAKWTYA